MKWNPDRLNISRYAIQSPAITLYLLVVLILAGLFAYSKIGQDEDPPFTFRVMVLHVAWPGATAMQMSNQVSSPLEKVIQEVGNVDMVRSYSKPGETTLFVDLADNTPVGEISQTWYNIRKRIGDMRVRLPEGLQGPFFDDEFGEVFGIIYALSGEGYTYRELNDIADIVRNELLRIKSVGKVSLIGLQERTVFIELSQLKIANLGFSPDMIASALTDQAGTRSFGKMEMGENALQVRMQGQLESVADISNLQLRINGKSVRLADVAEVYEGYQYPASPKFLSNGKEVVGIGISMSKGGDIIGLGQEVDAAMARLGRTLPAGIVLRKVQDQPAAVALSVGEFFRVLSEAIIIVLLVSFLALGLKRRPWRLDVRPGIVVALAIPAVLAATLIFMQWDGISLHKISLGALIIALGLLVDDAIIVVEMMVCKLEEGFDRLAASTYAFAATAMPMLTGTLITAIGFLPIGLAVSTVGEYTYAIFAVTTAALLSSWLVSVYFVPYLGYRLLKTGAHAEAARKTDNYPRLRRAVAWCIGHRWATIAMTLSALALGVVGMTQVEQQFFPASNRPEMLVDLWLPEGASMAASEALVRRVDKELRAQEGVASVSSFVGSSVPRFYLPIEQALPQSNFSQLIVLPKSHEDREALRRKLPDLLATQFPEARTRVQLLPNGPPVTYPVMFRVLGPNARTVAEIAGHVEQVVHADTAMRNTHDNWNEDIRTLMLAQSRGRMQELGLSYASLANSSNASLEGLAVGRVQDGDKLIDVVLRQPHTTYVDPVSLNGASLSTADGISVPLSQLGQARLAWEPGVVWRQNGDFAMTVQGEVIDGIQANTVASRIDTLLDQLRQGLPPGYHIEVAGSLAESGKGSDSINANVPLMLFLMFTLLMVQLRSFSRSLLVFLTGPLGIIGAAASLLLLGRPMGFVAMLGIIALNGMIIRNSLILVDQIEKEIAAGTEPWDAIIQAAAGRFRPILLTALAAVLAMIPLIQSTFWGPMAVAIMGGLVVATVLTLFSLPAMYAAWFRVKKPQGVLE